MRLGFGQMLPSADVWFCLPNSILRTLEYTIAVTLYTERTFRRYISKFKNDTLPQSKPSQCPDLTLLDGTEWRKLGIFVYGKCEILFIF